jgi:uncharacterized protein (DUF1800 family)
VRVAYTAGFGAPVPLGPRLDDSSQLSRAGPRLGATRKEMGLSRRRLLAGAAVGGVAVAAAGTLVLERPGLLPGFDRDSAMHNGAPRASVSRPRPGATARPAPPPPAPNLPAVPEPLLISQLLRRFAFGGSDALHQQALRQGYQQTVDQLLGQVAAQPTPLPGGEAPGATPNLGLEQLQQWWITHMVATPTPLQERLTLFMAGLFTTDARKVGTGTPFLAWQNRTWRELALSDLRTVLTRVSTDPAMLLYLDGNMSDGGAMPNQNYARELLERFTIGPVYSEQDVRMGALALSGWRVPVAGRDNTRTGVFEPARHFALPVRFLGREAPMNLAAVVDAILAHPACAPFVATRLVQEFVTPDPDPAYVDRLAASFRKSGYQLKTLVRDVLLSPEFAAQATYRGLVKSPLDFMVGAARLLGADPVRSAPLIRQYAADMDHAPFAPPDVGGYARNASWLTPLAMTQRVNFATDLVGAFRAVPAAATLVPRYLDGILSPGTTQVLAAAVTEPQRLWSLLASPDAQLA